jgi:glycosyltransferase involved in cell wall biosynthesis
MEKEYIPKPFRRIVAALFYHYETKIVKAIDAVVSPAPFEGKGSFIGRCKKLVYLNNYPMTNTSNSFLSDNESVNKRENAACYTGSISVSRGIINIIKACYLINVKLILAGEFESLELRSKIESMPEYSIVDYRGVCSLEEVAMILKEANVGLNVLRNVGQYANLPNLATKVYEYMSSGLPVVINKYPVGDQLLKKYQFGLSVDPDSIDDIAAKINDLISDSNYAQKLGCNGRRAFEEVFNWDVEEKKLFELYHDLSGEIIND